MNEVLSTVPVPRMNVDPEESCRTWVMDAIPQLQQMGCAEQFDVYAFVEYGLGDEWFSENPTLDGKKKKRANYTKRPM